MLFFPHLSLPLPQACTSLEVDIISLDLTQRLGMKLKSAAVKSAMKRGIHFEVGVRANFRGGGQVRYVGSA